MQNYIFIREDKSAVFYVNFVRRFFLYNPTFDDVEIHGTGPRNIYTLIKLTQILSKYNYGEVSMIRTKKVFNGF